VRSGGHRRAAVVEAVGSGQSSAEATAGTTASSEPSLPTASTHFVGTPPLPTALAAAAAIRAARSIVITTHVNPDGDAIGSMCGLGLICERLGKRVTRVSVDGVPEFYTLLPSAERVVRSADGFGPFDLGIGVDADGSDRLGEAEATILACPTVIDIDHHTGPDRYGTIQLIDPTAAATAEIVYDLGRVLEVPLDREIAECLMMALVTDTGAFRFPSVKPRTLRIATALMEAGAHPAPMAERVYGQRSPAATRLFGRALAKMEMLPCGRVVWSALSQNDFRETGARADETDGIINELRAVRGADLAMLLREEPDGVVRVSFRAREGVDAATLAGEFGGGGHRAASGATLPGPLAEATRRAVEAAARCVRDEA
jgi:bifunctional oligoribonuclease and PAP phosphatase NrnA